VIKPSGGITVRFDKIEIENFRVSAKEISDAGKLVSDDLKAAIDLARKNIELFHQSQTGRAPHHRNKKGVKCWQKKYAS